MLRVSGSSHMSITQLNKYEFLPSSIVGSLGFIVLLDLVCLPLELPEDAVIARGPFPPAITGFPLPRLVCSSLAFRVRGGGTRSGVGGSSAGGSSDIVSSSSSSSRSCTMIDEVRLGPDAWLGCLTEADLRLGWGLGVDLGREVPRGGTGVLYQG